MKTNQIRNVLCRALQKAEKGELPSEEAKSIIGLANQISTSLSTEAKVITMKLRMGQQTETFGQLDVTK